MTRFGVGITSLAMILGMATVPPAPHDVAVKTFKFRPDTLLVPAGDSIAWTNEDDIEHTVTADSSAPAGLWLHGTLATRGATYRVRASKPGLYPYHCERHPFMRGVVRVTPTGELP